MISIRLLVLEAETWAISHLPIIIDSVSVLRRVNVEVKCYLPGVVGQLFSYNANVCENGAVSKKIDVRYVQWAASGRGLPPVKKFSHILALLRRKERIRYADL